jgi:hypothetical protein
MQAARTLFSPQGFQWAALLALLTCFCGGAGFAPVENGSNETSRTVCGGRLDSDDRYDWER